MKKRYLDKSVKTKFATSAALWVSLLCGNLQGVSAAPFCENLSRFEPAANHTLPMPQSSEQLPIADCGFTQALSGGTSNHCFWSFPYRSDAARAFFEGTVKDISECTMVTSEPLDESAVNHPDSYDLRRFEEGGKVISISLKDKGALQKTVVFLRMERRQ
ncbi:MAG: hypothetical protein ABJ139_05415 [Paracoccaceae bacterium]